MEVFIGGLGGCGKIVVSKILQDTGFYPGHPGVINVVYDSPIVTTCYTQILSGKAGTKQLKEVIGRVVGDLERKFALKIGVSMLVPGQLRRIFPTSKFILCIRHPVNQICINRKYDPETVSFLGFGNHSYTTMPIEQKAEFWAKAYQFSLRELLLHYGTDFLIIKLEDMCEHTVQTIQHLLKFVSIDKEARFVSENVVKHKDYNIGYEKLSCELVRQVSEITKHTRLEFGYD
jgi:hypothetical protein